MTRHPLTDLAERGGAVVVAVEDEGVSWSVMLCVMACHDLAERGGAVVVAVEDEGEPVAARDRAALVLRTSDGRKTR